MADYERVIRRRRCPTVRTSPSEPTTAYVDRVLYVVEKVLTETRVRCFVEERGFGHLFLRGRKETVPDHRSRLRALSIASSPGTD
jgi:hypothetical protein